MGCNESKLNGLIFNSLEDELHYYQRRQQQLQYSMINLTSKIQEAKSDDVKERLLMLKIKTGRQLRENKERLQTIITELRSKNAYTSKTYV